MKVRFVVDVELDAEAIALEAQRRGFTLERARASVLADVECRLTDTIRWRDGIARVGVLQAEPAGSTFERRTEK